MYAQMYAPIVILTSLSAFLPPTSAMLSRRVINDPVGLYLSRVCAPGWYRARFNSTGPRGDYAPYIANSSFPCDQEIYIQGICTANGTAEIDFLAEQQCLCNGSFWEASAACSACYRIHGDTRTSLENATLSLSSLSVAECSPSPPYQPFSNLFPPFSVQLSSGSLSPSITLHDDKFPSDTAISHYFTPTGSLTPGDITGSATGRLLSWTNFDGVRFTPTNSPSSSKATTSSLPTTTAADLSTRTSSVSLSSSSSATANMAIATEAATLGSLLAAVLGVAIIL